MQINGLQDIASDGPGPFLRHNLELLSSVPLPDPMHYGSFGRAFSEFWAAVGLEPPRLSQSMDLYYALHEQVMIERGVLKVRYRRSLVPLLS
jgi:uncharacterized protein (DUF2236 family)